MALGDEGTLFVGSRREGKLHAVLDRNGDGRSDKTRLIAEDLNMPSGLAFRDGALYVGAVSRILRFDEIEQRLDEPGEAVVVTDALPAIRHHGWKYLRFGLDGWLYFQVGSPCNICESEDEIFASIARIQTDGTGLDVYAHGVRNSVGFDWHPETGELWFTDNGRDRLGDDVPPDEMNVAHEKGLHFGYPYCHGGDIADPELGAGHPCSDYEPPARNLGPHVAAIGMRFYTGEQFPEPYRNAIFIAEHGSWNRSQPIGYRVTTVRPEGRKGASYDVFAEGWLQEGEAWGRPADVLMMPDGALLVSDDQAGAIYRISYSP